MGLLDDAIKEHLELKRRRGADPTEIEREEREALGPVRRMADEGASTEAPAPASAPPEVDYADGPAPEPAIFDDETAHDHDLFEDDEFEEDTASHDVVTPDAPPPQAESTPEPEPAHAAYDEPITPYHEEDGPETAEYDVEAAHRAEDHGVAGHGEGAHGEEAPGPEDPSEEPHGEKEHGEEAESDDMLQETPEFLQDAPEHDRLWFEQRPPRDFDFDG